MHTSGTTGPSKGATATHAHACAYAHGFLEPMEVEAGDRFYAPLPLFRIAGQRAVCYAAAIGGASAAIIEHFSVERFRSDARRVDADVAFFLGAVANFPARQPERPDDATAAIDKAPIVPMFPDARDFGRRFGMRIETTCGSTETGAPLRMERDDPD